MKTEEAFVSLQVEEEEERKAPQFIEPLMKDVQVSQGRSATFQVQVTGNPAPVITWLKDNFLISPNHEYQVILHENSPKNPQKCRQIQNSVSVT